MATTNHLFTECITNIPEATKQEIAHSFAISNKIDEILKEQYLSQKDFAKMTGKTHNFNNLFCKQIVSRQFVLCNVPIIVVSQAI